MRSVIKAQNYMARRVVSSSTGFQSALGETSNVYAGGTLDARIRDQISSLASSGTMYATNGGPAFGITWMKVSADYYGGIMYGYYDDRLYQFKHIPGVYMVMINTTR